MIKLVLYPNFKFQHRIREAGVYTLVYCRNDIPTKVLETNCSCFRWALQDIEYELKYYLDQLFGDGNWEVVFMEEQNMSELLSKTKDNDIVVDYASKRRQYHLPPWSETDKFRFGYLE